MSDGLFKLLIYIIIGVVYFLSNKKQIEADNKKPNYPKPAQKPLRPQTPVTKPRYEERPQREGDFADNNQKPVQDVNRVSYQKFKQSFEDDGITASFDQFKRSYYDEKLEAKKKRLEEKRLGKKAAKPAPVMFADKQEKTTTAAKVVDIKPRVAHLGDRQGYHLKSNIKEGIIWSIVLGPPRAKQTVNWGKSPVNR
jgi:hypothetical protein